MILVPSFTASMCFILSPTMHSCSTDSSTTHQDDPKLFLFELEAFNPRPSTNPNPHWFPPRIQMPSRYLEGTGMSNLHPDLTFASPTTQMHSDFPISSTATKRLIYQHHTSMPPRTQTYPPWPPTSSILIAPLPPSFAPQSFLTSSASVALLAEFFTELHGNVIYLGKDNTELKMVFQTMYLYLHVW